MKKKLVGLFAVLLCAVMLAACSGTAKPDAAAQSNGTESPSVSQPSSDNPPQSAEPDTALAAPLYNSVIEYGEAQELLDNNGPAFTYIRYPATGDFAVAVFWSLLPR